MGQGCPPCPAERGSGREVTRSSTRSPLSCRGCLLCKGEPRGLSSLRGWRRCPPAPGTAAAPAWPQGRGTRRRGEAGEQGRCKIPRALFITPAWQLLQHWKPGARGSGQGSFLVPGSIPHVRCPAALCRHSASSLLRGPGASSSSSSGTNAMP